jgi:hypothetical protein
VSRSGWEEEERRAFAAFLKREGVEESAIGTWLGWADRVIVVSGGGRVLPKHVDEAVRRATGEGASGSALAAIRRSGDALVRHTKDLPPRRADAPPAREPGSPGDGLELVAVGRQATRPSRPGQAGTFTSRPPATRGRCVGCGGALEIVGDGAPMLALGGGGILSAIAAYLAVRVIGWIGVLVAVGLFLAAVFVWQALFACFACSRCNARAKGPALDEEQRSRLSAVRARHALGAVGSAAIAIGGAIVWSMLAAQYGGH